MNDLTKREQIAIEMMSALISNSVIAHRLKAASQQMPELDMSEALAKMALEHTDALMKQLDIID